MEITESYRVFLRPGLVESQNLRETLEVSGQVPEILKNQKVIINDEQVLFQSAQD
jgi:hypothetical protein